MILTTTQLDEKTDPVPYASESAPATARRHDTQVFYATMPSPMPAPAPADVESVMARMSLTSDAPPAYEESNQAVSNARANELAHTGDEKSDIFEDGNDNHASGSTASTARIIDNGSNEPHFPPLVLHSKGGTLQEGFYRMLPPTDVSPHPFVSRNVKEEDWTDFLSELQTSARNVSSSTKSAQSSNGLGFVNSLFRSMSCPKKRVDGMEKGATADAAATLAPGDLVDAWNKDFFNPRGLEVVLARGNRRLSGDKVLPPPDCPEISKISIGAAGQQLARPLIDPMGFALRGAGGFGRGRGRWWHEFEHVPVQGRTLAPRQANRARSHSAGSISSDSSDSESESDSDSDEEESHRNQVSPATRNGNPSTGLGDPTQTQVSMTWSERRAARRARRAARRAARRERRAARRARRAARREHRGERRSERWERRVVRKEARCMRKLGRLDSELAKRGVGLDLGLGLGLTYNGVRRGGMCAGRGAGPADLIRDVVGMRLGFLRDTEVGGNDGYYRLVVVDAHSSH